MRDNPCLKVGTIGTDDGEGDSVQGDAPLVDQVSAPFFGNSEPQYRGAGLGVDRDDFGGCIDVALDDVAAKSVVSHHCTLQVDDAADLEVAQGGPIPGFLAQVKGEGVVFHHGQTASVDGDRLAFLEQGRLPHLGSGNSELVSSSLKDGAKGLNDAGEHLEAVNPNLYFATKLAIRGFGDLNLPTSKQMVQVHSLI